MKQEAPNPVLGEKDGLDEARGTMGIGIFAALFVAGGYLIHLSFERGWIQSLFG